MPNAKITAAELAKVQKRKPTGQRKTTAAAMTLEKDVAQAGVEWLRLNGWMVHRLQADRHSKGGNRKRHEREEPGTPDYICHKKNLDGGRGDTLLFYWEAKRTEGGVIRQSQKDWKAAHPHHMVSYAASFEELQRWMKAYFPWTIKTRRGSNA